MSRICVKNIGKSCNEAQLKDVFSKKGEITDVKIIKNQKSHNSRNFAFIGFRTELQAEEAIKYFNNTFIGLSRISVELARKLGDHDLKAEKQKHSLSAKEKLKQLKEKTKEQQDAQVNDDKKSSKSQDKPAVLGKNKKEFLEVVSRPSTMQKVSERLEAQRAPEPADQSDEEVKDQDDDESDDDSAIDLGELMKKNAEKKVGEAKEIPSRPLSDLDYLRSKVTIAWSDDEDEDDEEGEGRPPRKEEEEEEDDSQPMDEDEDEEAADRPDDDEEEERGERGGDHRDGPDTENAKEVEGDGEESETDEARLFLRNIPYSATEDELRALGEKFGTVAEVHIPLDKDRGGKDKDKDGEAGSQEKEEGAAGAGRVHRGNKGFGFLSFMFPQHADAALAALDGSSFQGRVLFVTRAKKQKEKEVQAVQLSSGNTRLSSFQQQKEEERRKQMLKRESWNASFVRSDAVMETIKDRYGVEQSALLNTADLKSADLAVRLAVAETQIVQENKDFFLAHGIHLDVLESVNSNRKSLQRSTTTLLVKNLPPDADLEELESMFAKFGEIASFLVPPSRTVAVVDFLEPSEARAAFKSLAYRRYKNGPLFLEWAPTGTMTAEYERDKQKRKEQGPSAPSQQQQQQQQKPSQAAPPSSSSSSSGKQQPQHSTEAAEDDDLADFSTLFVKNLNFSTSEPALRDFLVNSLRVEGVRAVIIQKKQKGSQLLSQGYGFVEFKNAALAQAAVGKMQGAVLDSHKLEVKPSDKRLTAAPASSQLMRQLAAQQRQTKLIVRNVAFQASKEEIRALFASFGSVKSVRIPKKMTGAHRGFAFVEFSTSQEALNAMTALKSTHLYGRHLVLEWAKAEDEPQEGGEEVLGGDGQVASLRKRAREDQERLELAQKKRQRRAGQATGEDDGDEEVRALL